MPLFSSNSTLRTELERRPDTLRSRLLWDFSDLLSSIWSSPAPSVVDPHHLVTDVKILHPSFRGYAQQDTQEFLRSFLDSLHEELKEKVVEPQQSNGMWLLSIFLFI